MASRDELYAKFGITAEAAQLFETDLGTMLLAFEAEERGWHVSPDGEQASEFYERLNRKTVGQLLNALRRYADFDDGVANLFGSAVAARNRLNHGFFERHNFAIQTAEGRDAMIADLEVMHQCLFDAWQLTQRFASMLWESLQRTRRES